MACRPWLAAAFVAFASGCEETVQIELRLVSAVAPDPFAEVATVRVSAQTEDETVSLTPVRWDQGPISFDALIPIGAFRVWVEGLDREGRTVSIARSLPLDLVRDPPTSLSLFFAQVGQVSLTGATVEPRIGYRAASLGPRGVLLLGGEAADGSLSETTWRLDPSGEIVAGPTLPGGRAGSAVASVGNLAVAWGGRTRTSSVSMEWAALSATGLNRFITNLFPGEHPVLLASSTRRADAIDPVVGRWFEMDVTDGLTREVGALRPRAGGSFVSLGFDFFVAFGGRGEPSASLFERRSGRTIASAPLGSELTSASLASIGRTSALVASEAGLLALRFDEVTQTGTAALFADGRTEVGGLFDAGAGELVMVGPHAARVQLFQRTLHPMVGVDEETMLAPFPDGTLRGVSPDGSIVAYAPGIGAWVPSFSPARGLSPDIPEAWSKEGAEVVATADLGSTELRIGDPLDLFEIELTVIPEGRGRASLRYGIENGRFVEIRLERSAQFRDESGPRSGCPVAEIPQFDEGQSLFRVRLSRVFAETGRWVRLDVGADGSIELECFEPSATGGRLGVAVRRGRVRFAGLELRGRPPVVP